MKKKLLKNFLINIINCKTGKNIDIIIMDIEMPVLWLMDLMSSLKIKNLIKTKFMILIDNIFF